MSVHYKNVCCKEGLLWEFDQDSAGSDKICPLQKGSTVLACFEMFNMFIAVDL